MGDPERTVLASVSGVVSDWDVIVRPFKLS